jgi:hypothetical protein
MSQESKQQTTQYPSLISMLSINQSNVAHTSQEQTHQVKEQKTPVEEHPLSKYDVHENMISFSVVGNDFLSVVLQHLGTHSKSCAGREVHKPGVWLCQVGPYSHHNIIPQYARCRSCGKIIQKLKVIDDRTSKLQISRETPTIVYIGTQTLILESPHYCF